MVQKETSRAKYQKSVKKTEAILQGAMQEFLVNGYAGARMDRIAAVAGVSKATVYSYFQDKEKLFTALIQRLAEERFQIIFNSPHPKSIQEEPKIFLRRLATQVLDFALEDKQFHDFIRIVIGESGRFPELAEAYVQNLAQPVIKILSEYLRSHSELKLRDPEAAVRVFIGTLVYYVILQELLHGKKILPMERERLTDTLISFMIPEELL